MCGKVRTGIGAAEAALCGAEMFEEDWAQKDETN